MKLTIEEFINITAAVINLLDDNNIDVVKSDVFVNLKRLNDNSISLDVYGQIVNVR